MKNLLDVLSAHIERDGQFIAKEIHNQLAQKVLKSDKASEESKKIATNVTMSFYTQSKFITIDTNEIEILKKEWIKIS